MGEYYCLLLCMLLYYRIIFLLYEVRCLTLEIEYIDALIDAHMLNYYTSRRRYRYQ